MNTLVKGYTLGDKMSGKSENRLVFPDSDNYFRLNWSTRCTQKSTSSIVFSGETLDNKF